MHSYFIRLSRLFIPASETRLNFQLPEDYPLPSGFCLKKEKNKSVKEHLKFILTTPLLETVVKSLLSDIDAWSTKYEPYYFMQAKWIAERFLIWLYDLDTLQEKYTLNSLVQNVLQEQYLDAKSNFFQQFPDLETAQHKNIPSFDNRCMWVALQAYNLKRFQTLDAMETFEESMKVPDVMFDWVSLEETNFAEAQLIYATRVREHAMFSVLLCAGEVLKLVKPTAIPTAEGLMRKYLKLNPKKSTFDLKHKGGFEGHNISSLLSLVRTILHMYHKIRLVVDVTGKYGNIEHAQLLIQGQASWCEIRIPSLLALKATSDKTFFQAVRNFEAACIAEGNCLTALATSKTIFLSIFDAKNLHFFKPSFLRLHLSLAKDDMDEKLFRNLTVEQKKKLEERFEVCKDFLTPTFKYYLAFVKMYSFYDAKFQSQDCIQIISRMLVNVDFYSTFQKVVDDSVWIEKVKTVFPNEIPYSLKYVFKMYQTRINEKLEGLQNMVQDSFCSIELPEQEFLDLVDLAKKREWEMETY